jgi:hypothetical protein
MMSRCSDATLESVNAEGGQEDSKKGIIKKVGSFDLWTGLNDQTSYLLISSKWLSCRDCSCSCHLCQHWNHLLRFLM